MNGNEYLPQTNEHPEATDPKTGQERVVCCW